MGISHPESKPWVSERILEINPKTVMDVGAGAGVYAQMMMDIKIKATTTAVEVWGPYIRKFNLRSKYHKVIKDDVRNIQNFYYDLVIMGDVLEHMSKEDAIKVWDRVSRDAQYAILVIPIIHYHQGAINDNPYEEHIKDDWTHEEVLKTFPEITDFWLGDVVGAYIAEFEV